MCIYVLPFVLKENLLHMDVCRYIEPASCGVNLGGKTETSKTKGYCLSYRFVHFEFVS